MVNRRGESRIGCLIPILILALAIYFAFDVGMAYFRFYQFKDAIVQEARFGADRTDEQITKRLSSLADSLQLPPGGELISIERTTTLVTISADYDEVIRLPMNKTRVIHFHPSASSRP